MEESEAEEQQGRVREGVTRQILRQQHLQEVPT